MMFNLCMLYIIFYMLITLCFFTLICFHVPIKVFFSLSIPKTFVYIQKYTIFKKTYFMLFFCLTGLPPVGLFFVKFNLCVQLIYQLNFSFIVFFVLFFFLNILFYSQIFSHKNIKVKLYSDVTPSNIRSWEYSTTFAKNKRGYKRYHTMFYIHTTLLFIVLTFFFIGDYFLVIGGL